jgi:hypothetical protein
MHLRIKDNSQSSTTKIRIHLIKALLMVLPTIVAMILNNISAG